ncbi:MAG: bacteriohemerythrin [Treponema sp.]|nr:bacteriohemerythrin [Treponema sp.]
MFNHDSELISWSNTFACGVKLIDDQHKELVELVNEMFNHVSGNEEQEREYLNDVMQKAIKYIKVHFATEEKIMTLTKFSGYASHKRAHNGFIVIIIDTLNEITCGKHISLYTFTKFLKNWVLSHIAVMDKQYFEYFRKIATRKDDGKVSITPADVQFVNIR